METTVQEVAATEAAPSTPEPAAPVARKARSTAKRSTKGKVVGKGAAKAAAKSTAKARQPIPAGMTRSRGALIPAANGRQCGLVGTGGGQCRNPGRWPATINGQQVVTCSTHKRSAKQVVFAAKPKGRSRKATTQVAAQA